jgi:hypothetical protein
MKRSWQTGVAVVLLGVGVASAQEIRPQEPARPLLEFRPGFWHSGYYYGERPIRNMSELGMILSASPEARRHIRAARWLGLPAGILGGAGGFLIGWSIGSAIGGDPDWTFALVGAGTIAAAVPFSIAQNIQMRKAVEAFNARPASAGRREPRTEVFLCGNAAGLRVAF